MQRRADTCFPGRKVNRPQNRNATDATVERLALEHKGLSQRVEFSFTQVFLCGETPLSTIELLSTRQVPN